MAQITRRSSRALCLLAFLALGSLVNGRPIVMQQVGRGKPLLWPHACTGPSSTIQALQPGSKPRPVLPRRHSLLLD